MAEEKQVKSRRDQFGERLKKKYPDREYADDEALFGQINDDYDEYDSQLSGYKERESKLTDMFTRDPQSAQFITDMAQGKDPWASLINRIGIDGVKEMLDDPAKMEEFSKSNKEYVDRMAKQKGLEEEWEKNMKTTLSMLEQKQQELGLTDEQIDQAADLSVSSSRKQSTWYSKPSTMMPTSPPQARREKSEARTPRPRPSCASPSAVTAPRHLPEPTTPLRPHVRKVQSLT